MRAILLLMMLLWPVSGMAEPVAQYDNGVVRVTLTNEPCSLDWIKMDHRATWRKPSGEVLDGCWTIRPVAGVYVVVSIFSADRVFSLLEEALFKQVTPT